MLRWLLVPILGAMLIAAPTAQAEIGVGSAGACVLDRGAVRCWGGPGAWLGERLAPGRQPSAAESWPATAVALAGRARRMGVGEDAACASVAPRGRVYCWGTDPRTIFDDAPQGSATPTLVRSAGSQVKELRVARGVACSLGRGRVHCWGAADPAHAPRNVGRPTALAVSETHACVVDRGLARCWGTNLGHMISASTGDGDSVRDARVVAGMRRVRQVATSRYATCSLDVSGGVWCVGLYGRKPVRRTRRLANLPPLRTITAAGEHFCGLTSAGVAYCWGSRYGGALGIPSGVADHPLQDPVNGGQLVQPPTYVRRPVRVRGVPALTSISAGDGATCGTSNLGDVWCWGDAVVAAPNAADWPFDPAGWPLSAAPRLSVPAR